MAELLKSVFTPKAKKQYQKLSINIQTKFTKQLRFLLTNYRHPSLRARKIGEANTYEARIDIHYRFTFQIKGGEIYILTIGPHDEGLGKK